MDYNLETPVEKLRHVKITLWNLQQEQDNKGNAALAYVLQHLCMITDNARMEIEDKQ